MSARLRIAKFFDFDAAHWLPHVASGHKCGRMHGHTYRVELIYEGVPDARGMVVDYSEIAIAWDPIHRVLDHQVLNEITGLENPTTEVLAPWIMDMLTKGVAYMPLVGVRVYESSTTYCEVWKT
jgi:6-pyruvoyltetrahydropterin/6-carboxytetrahydropterin synthase